VLYGSQTGTAMSFAQQFGELASATVPTVSVEDLMEYDATNLPQETGAVVLVVSCFGKGEATDSAKRFYSWFLANTASLKGKGTHLLV
jgi:sulfite reductase alpha subunit-like flavoprotein